MHGNVAEWTASDYVPYAGSVARFEDTTQKVVRGGSWYDRPKRATSSYRLAYPAWEILSNVDGAAKIRV